MIKIFIKNKKEIGIVEEPEKQEQKYPTINLATFPKKGIIQVVGDSGSGRTTFSNALIHYLATKETFKNSIENITILTGFSGGSEYFLRHAPVNHLIRYLPIDYPELIERLKKNKDINPKEISEMFHDLKLKYKSLFLKKPIHIFQVLEFLDSSLYKKLLKNFLLYFSTKENSIIAIDHIVINKTVDKTDQEVINAIKRASENNLVIINMHEPIETLAFKENNIFIDPKHDNGFIKEYLSNQLNENNIIVFLKQS